MEKFLKEMGKRKKKEEKRIKKEERKRMRKIIKLKENEAIQSIIFNAATVEDERTRIFIPVTPGTYAKPDADNFLLGFISQDVLDQILYIRIPGPPIPGVHEYEFRPLGDFVRNAAFPNTVAGMPGIDVFIGTLRRN